MFKDCYSNCHVPHAVILYTIFNVYHHALVIWTVHNVMLDSDGQLLLHAHTLELSQLLQEIFLLSIDFLMSIYRQITIAFSSPYLYII